MRNYNEEKEDTKKIKMRGTKSFDYNTINTIKIIWIRKI